MTSNEKLEQGKKRESGTEKEEKIRSGCGEKV